jgi:hypothetical protein
MKALIGREKDEDVNNQIIPNKMRIILETAKKIGGIPTTPYLKYWF